MIFNRPSYIEEIRRETQKLTPEKQDKNFMRNKLNKNPDFDLFHIKPADQWLLEEYSKPEARQLMGTLWHEHELCILFADTNLGKSVLAVQVGYHLSVQGCIAPFGSGVNECLKVLYIDFELTPAQFKARYTHATYGAHRFGPNFIRAEFNPNGDDPLLYDNYEEYVRQRIEGAILATKAQVLIIDNITCMGSKTGNATSALSLMKNLKALKIKHKLSVLVLAHTPKRNLHSPVTVNDLQGSKMLINFADSAFALGQSSQNQQWQYLKQIKQRNTGSHFGADHICLFRIGKQLSFLSFEFIGFDNEHAHLQKVGVTISDETRQKIIELSRQGLSCRQAADHLKISESTVRRVLTKVEAEGN